MKEYKLKINGNEYVVEIASVEGNVAEVTVNGKPYSVEVEKTGSNAAAPVVYKPAVSAQKAAPVTPVATQSKNGSAIVSPLPGTVLRVNVAVGDVVKAGQVVAVVEAMKMENDIEAEVSGTVTAVNVKECDSVLEGAVLITVA